MASVRLPFATLPYQRATSACANRIPAVHLHPETGTLFGTEKDQGVIRLARLTKGFQNVPDLSSM